SSEAPLDCAGEEEIGCGGADCAVPDAGAGGGTCERAATGATLLPPYAASAGHFARTRAFQDGAKVSQPAQDGAHTGRSDWRTAEFDLTAFVPARAWLVFEVRTMPDTLGEDVFSDPAAFPLRARYGFELDSVYSFGNGWHRNVRVKDVAGDLRPMPADAGHGDASDVRAVVPPGNSPLLVRVQNAGQYVENATLQVVLGRSFTGSSLQRNDEAFSETTLDPIPVRAFRPSEVREVRVPWPEAVKEDALYRVRVALRVESVGTEVLPNATNATVASDPGTTPVRPVNVAEEPTGKARDGNGVEATAFLRGYTRQDVRAAPPEAGAGANPILVCSSIHPVTGCQDAFDGKRGEPRYVMTGVRNLGSVAETVRVALTLSLDGVDRAAMIDGGPLQVVEDLQPGETRAVTWRIVPTEPGAYLARVQFQVSPLKPGVLAGERLVFVQRTTGTICFDDLADQRACSPSFSAERVDLLAGKDVTAALAAADGALQVVAGDGASQALFARTAAGAFAVANAVPPAVAARTRDDWPTA
ncbi:MAG TPA: hypothetical protein VHH36_03890, partial [Candidatus Thermoplasmatota archaeon]|nr:hypothetical protein [Candidatus Thermoplasmatota archaeon]